MDQASATHEKQTESALRRWRAELLLAAVVLLLAAPIMQPLMAQQASRYALTAALVDQRTVVLDDYEATLGVDRALRDGHTYSDKAPGQPVLATPVYLVYRLIGGEPATEYRPWGNLGLWFASLISAAFPAALLAAGMRRLALRIAPRFATPAALAVAVGTMLLPFATQLFSHVLSAALALGAYLLLMDRPVSRWRLIGAGALAAAAITVEYSAGIASVVLFGVAVARHHWRAGWFVLGGAPLGALLGLYHWITWGSPFRFSYQFSQFNQNKTGVIGVHPPQSLVALEVLFGERGLFFLTPIVLVGVAGAVVLLRDRDRRFHSVVALTVFGLFCLHMFGWGNPTGGASPGPRYVIPSLPFLVVGVAEGLRRWPFAAGLAGLISAATMGLATLTLPLAPRDHPFALAYWAQRAAEGEWAQTLFTRTIGSWALWPPVVAAVLVAAWLLWSERSGEAVRPADQRQLQGQAQPSHDSGAEQPTGA